MKANKIDTDLLSMQSTASTKSTTIQAFSICKQVEKSKLVCFDFDKTITKYNISAKLDQSFMAPASPGVLLDGAPVDATEMNPYYDANTVIKHTKMLLQNQSALCCPNATLKTIRTLLENGHYVAITSFSLYPDAITETLQRLGLSNNEIKNIHIVSGGEAAGNKSALIEIAMKAYGITSKEYVILYDDDPMNISNARCNGYKAVLAKGKSSLEQLLLMNGDDDQSDSANELSTLATTTQEFINFNISNDSEQQQEYKINQYNSSKLLFKTKGLKDYTGSYSASLQIAQEKYGEYDTICKKYGISPVNFSGNKQLNSNLQLQGSLLFTKRQQKGKLQLDEDDDIAALVNSDKIDQNKGNVTQLSHQEQEDVMQLIGQDNNLCDNYNANNQ